MGVQTFLSGLSAQGLNAVGNAVQATAQVTSSFQRRTEAEKDTVRTKFQTEYSDYCKQLLTSNDTAQYQTATENWIKDWQSNIELDPNYSDSTKRWVRNEFTAQKQENSKQINSLENIANDTYTSLLISNKADILRTDSNMNYQDAVNEFSSFYKNVGAKALIGRYNIPTPEAFAEQIKYDKTLQNFSKIAQSSYKVSENWDLNKAIDNAISSIGADYKPDLIGRQKLITASLDTLNSIEENYTAMSKAFSSQMSNDLLNAQYNGKALDIDSYKEYAMSLPREYRYDFYKVANQAKEHNNTIFKEQTEKYMSGMAFLPYSISENDIANLSAMMSGITNDEDRGEVVVDFLTKYGTGAFAETSNVKQAVEQIKAFDNPYLSQYISEDYKNQAIQGLVEDLKGKFEDQEDLDKLIIATKKEEKATQEVREETLKEAVPETTQKTVTQSIQSKAIVATEEETAITPTGTDKEVVSSSTRVEKPIERKVLTKETTPRNAVGGLKLTPSVDDLTTTSGIESWIEEESTPKLKITPSEQIKNQQKLFNIAVSGEVLPEQFQEIARDMATSGKISFDFYDKNVKDYSNLIDNTEVKKVNEISINLAKQFFPKDAVSEDRTREILQEYFQERMSENPDIMKDESKSQDFQDNIVKLARETKAKNIEKVFETNTAFSENAEAFIKNISKADEGDILYEIVNGNMRTMVDLGACYQFFSQSVTTQDGKEIPYYMIQDENSILDFFADKMGITEKGFDNIPSDTPLGNLQRSQVLLTAMYAQTFSNIANLYNDTFGDIKGSTEATSVRDLGDCFAVQDPVHKQLWYVPNFDSFDKKGITSWQVFATPAKDSEPMRWKDFRRTVGSFDVNLYEDYIMAKEEKEKYAPKFREYAEQYDKAPTQDPFETNLSKLEAPITSKELISQAKVKESEEKKTKEKMEKVQRELFTNGAFLISQFDFSGNEYETLRYRRK